MRSLVFTIFSIVAITACSKKSSNAAAPPPSPAVGLCTVGPNNTCVGQTPFTGRGFWKGYLQIIPGQAGLYAQMLRTHRLCRHGYQCYENNPFVGVSIRLEGATGRVTITPFEGEGWSVRRLRREANVTTVNNASSFNLVLIDPNVYFSSQIMAPNNGIQVSGTFVTPVGDVISTNLFYAGVPIASGQLQGQRYPY